MECMRLDSNPLPQQETASKEELIEASKRLIELFKKYVAEEKPGYIPNCNQKATIVDSLSNLEEALSNPWRVLEINGDWATILVKIAYVYARIDVEESKKLFLTVRNQFLEEYPSSENVKKLEQLMRLQSEIDPEEAKNTLTELTARIHQLIKEGRYQDPHLWSAGDEMLIKVIGIGAKLDPEKVYTLLDEFRWDYNQVKGWIGYAAGLADSGCSDEEVEKAFEEAEKIARQVKNPLDSLIKVGKEEYRYRPEFSERLLQYVNRQAVQANAKKHFLREAKNSGQTVRYLDGLRIDGKNPEEQLLRKEALNIRKTCRRIAEALDEEQTISEFTDPNRLLNEEVAIKARSDLASAEKIIPKIMNQNYLASAYSTIAQVQAKSDVKAAWETIDKIPPDSATVSSFDEIGAAEAAIVLEELKESPERALATARKIDYSYHRSLALTAIVEAYAASHLSWMKNIAQEIDDQYYRGKAFSVIALTEILSNDPEKVEGGYRLIKDKQAFFNLVFSEFSRKFDLKVIGSF